MHRTIIVSLFFLFFAPSALRSEEVRFIKNDLKTALDRAGAEGKLIFVDFWASYCSPCRLMEEYTFPEPSVSDKLNAAYIPVKIDIEDFDGYDLKNQYKVTALPTILILDSKGHLIARYEESMGASTLTKVLEKYDQQKYRTRRNNLMDNGGYNANTSFSNSSARVTLGSTKPTEENALKPSNYAPENRAVSLSSAPVVRKMTATPTKEIAHTAPATGNVKKRISFPIQGYTVKVGTFATDTGIQNTYSRYKSYIADTGQKIFVHDKNINGRLLHRLLIGQFTTHQQAENFKLTNHLQGNVMAFAVLK
jgi:thioredoxin-related protein